MARCSAFLAAEAVSNPMVVEVTLFVSWYDGRQKGLAMESDPHFYEIFKKCPRLLNVLVPLNHEAGYSFRSVTFKRTHRSSDGVIEPEDPSEPTYILEFQVSSDKTVYPRILVEMALYNLEHADRDIRGILVFPREADDPKPDTWTRLITCGRQVRIFIFR